jgi:hypothetical protein
MCTFDSVLLHALFELVMHLDVVTLTGADLLVLAILST